MRQRTAWIASGVATIVLGVGGAAVFGAMTQRPIADDMSAPEADTSFYSVARLDLADTITSQGTLDYGDAESLTGVLPGTITALPVVGDVVERGDALYRVDNTPVVLMIGELPAWRGFDVSMTNGPDVTQLETNLRDLGFFNGEPNERFDWVTREAVRDWQESLGMPRTGEVERGRIVFEPAARRVGAISVALRDEVGGREVLTLTGQERTVTVQLPIADQRIAENGGTVQIGFPGGTETTGKITSIGGPKEVQEDAETKLVIPLVISLDEPAAGEGLQRISVSVRLQKAVYEQVLAVPVTALIALPGGQLGVEKLTDDGLARVAVETGVFVQGFVDITGGDIAEGDRVVVPR